MEQGIYLDNRQEFKDGMKAGIPIFMGYFPISLTFGLIAKATGLSAFLAVFMSLTNFTGATQFIGVNMLSQGIGVGNIVLTTFMINARYLLMSFCFADKLKGRLSNKEKAFLAFGITDEVFVVSMTKEKLGTSYTFGAQIISYSGWVVGTLMGVLLADILPSSIISSIGIAIYIMFLGLLIPALIKSLKVAIVSVLAMVISSIIYWVPNLNNLIGNWRIIITIIISSLLGAIFLPVGEER
ncbi:AzlC family ABC transporter permease [Orenia marismortui]|uniref:4-azaleucine resistance transporter AzlC n=1 Tax=Orenia marismortui TaxID=46469 RepID=A0A4R8GZ89_9FIRM|nr:AzlC family ABC transporter permease [Orenia marismortui]TDX51826.1 4-azaleucine resistance transporter AzlC [Orenia marismortui]